MIAGVSDLHGFTSPGTHSFRWIPKAFRSFWLSDITMRSSTSSTIDSIIWLTMLPIRRRRQSRSLLVYEDNLSCMAMINRWGPQDERELGRTMQQPAFISRGTDDKGLVSQYITHFPVHHSHPDKLLISRLGGTEGAARSSTLRLATSKEGNRQQVWRAYSWLCGSAWQPRKDNIRIKKREKRRRFCPLFSLLGVRIDRFLKREILDFFLLICIIQNSGSYIGRNIILKRGLDIIFT